LKKKSGEKRPVRATFLKPSLKLSL